jgi:hypothetical protein
MIDLHFFLPVRDVEPCERGGRGSPHLSVEDAYAERDEAHENDLQE